jgi:UDP-glucose 4-epimerase
MIVVVTGGTGFLGRPLVRALTAEGHSVRVLTRRPHEVHVGTAHPYRDLRDRTALEKALEGADVVFHLAWSSLPQTSNEDPLADCETNLAGGIALLEACRAAGVSQVVFPSSGGTVYGFTPDGVVTEETPTDPICAYGISKLAFEKYLALYQRIGGPDYRVLRISNAYGEGQPSDRPQGLIGVALDRMLRDQPITVLGDGTAVRDYVHVDDVVRAFLAAMQPLGASAPRVFNVGSGRGYSINEVLEIISGVTGCTPTLKFEPARSCDLDRVVVSAQRSEETLGWTPSVTLETGVARTCVVAQQRPEAYQH